MRGYIIFGYLLLASISFKIEARDNLIVINSTYWINDGKEQPISDSLFYKDNPSPIFRKVFSINSKLKSAKLMIAATGYYKATINGKRVGQYYLDPAWTNTNKRVYYREYNITDLLYQNNNCIGVILGNGFYNPLPLRMWGNRNLRESLNVGNPKFICKIVIEYEDGHIDEIGSNESWKFSYSPVLKNNVYIGEVFDLGKTIDNWDSVGFLENNWKYVKRAKSAKGQLIKSFFPGIEIIEKIIPQKIYSINNDTYIVDMGVNFTGTYKIRLKENAGDSILFRFGERIYEDGTLNPMTTVAGQVKSKGMGGPGAPDIAWQSDILIFDSDTTVWYQPEFTFHTYRYMELSGLNYRPDTSDITGLLLSTNVVNDNNFSTSSDLINSIQEASRRTFLSNLQSVQSDCSAREKFGYGGDLNATSEAFIYNFDIKSFHRKTIYDWVDAINDSIFIDTAPYVGIKYCGLSWESAFLTTQYYLYLYYNDTEIVKELYEFNKRWMEKVERLHPKYIVDFGLGDHESLTTVPVELTGTCHYLQCAEIMYEFSKLMDDEKSQTIYSLLKEKIREKLKEYFWDNPVDIKINKQTLYSSLLYYNVLPDKEKNAAVDSLIQSINDYPSNHFTTGIFGTKHILNALSEYVSSEKVLQIVNDTRYPGWGYMIDRGATTIWETWKESDNTYSNCHPMFGSVSEWFYKWIGGIKVNKEYPGFKKFTLSPTFSDQLNYMNCTYASPYGLIVSKWKRYNGKIIYVIEIPEGSEATIDLSRYASFNILVESDERKLKSIVKTDNGIFELGFGKYIITLSK